MNTVIYKLYIRDAKADIENLISDWELKNNKVFPEAARMNAWRIAVVLWTHVRLNNIKASQKETVEEFGLSQSSDTMNTAVFESRVKEAHRTMITSATPDGRAYSDLMAALKAKYSEFISKGVIPRSKNFHVKRKYSTSGEFIVPSQIRKSNIQVFNMLGKVMEDIVSGLSYDAIQAKRDVTIKFIHTAYHLYTERSPVLISLSSEQFTQQK